MRIAALMETFPAWSETYILWHMAELVRSGQSLSIFPSTLGKTSPVQPEVGELGLLLSPAKAGIGGQGLHSAHADRGHASRPWRG